MSGVQPKLVRDTRRRLVRVLELAAYSNRVPPEQWPSPELDDLVHLLRFLGRREAADHVAEWSQSRDVDDVVHALSVPLDEPPAFDVTDGDQRAKVFDWLMSKLVAPWTRQVSLFFQGDVAEPWTAEMKDGRTFSARTPGLLVEAVLSAEVTP